MKLELQSILSLLKFGKPISVEQKNFIRDRIINFENSEELDVAIRAFGLSNSPTKQNIQFIEQFLDFDCDIVLSAAVNVLCGKSYWRLAPNYLEKLKKYVLPKNSVILSETQIVSFTVLGDYLYENNDVKLFSYLCQIFIDGCEKAKEENSDVSVVFIAQVYRCLDIGIHGYYEAVLNRRSDKIKFLKLSQFEIEDVLRGLKAKFEAKQPL